MTDTLRRADHRPAPRVGAGVHLLDRLIDRFENSFATAHSSRNGADGSPILDS
jgi:hypothetical protein